MYQIKINNPIFYNKLGKYESIMNLLTGIGFRRIYKQVNSAFQYVQDANYYEIQEMLSAWKIKDRYTLNTPSVLEKRDRTLDITSNFNVELGG